MEHTTPSGASYMAEIGIQVKVFNMGDAVSAAKKGQVTPEVYYNLEKMVIDLVSKGVEVKLCGGC